ncbi:hypothetical protein LXA43DRAFT_10411 [Ganoderma leucocontextum]|nr:hypothetical protein LXA43DRAFT_10411 [Ganoderma leucocontextum]
MTAYVDYHLGLCSSNQDSVPALRGQEEAWNLATSTYMHGTPHMTPYQSLPPPVYYDSYAEELSLSQNNHPVYPNFTLAAAPTTGAFHASFTPSESPIPSPIYPGGDIQPKAEIMEYGSLHPTALHPTYAPPTPTTGARERMRCQWKDCPIELDDLSHSGIRRHFREYHNMPRGSTVRCEWEPSCRSEAMLYDNIAKHIAECHLKSMKTACKACGNMFARNDTLKRHLDAGCPALARR